MEPTASTARSLWTASACALAATAVAMAGAFAAAFGQPAAAGAREPGELPPLPAKLSDTGLFVAGSTTEVDPRSLQFVPQYPLWTDGAHKRRWIRLPKGAAIDASDPDAWQFPIGTRLWKEISFGSRVETRYIERAQDGSFRFAAYVWAADGSDAYRLPADQGKVIATGGGHLHEVPRESDCRSCHEGRASRVLGFNALQLSSDRDPNALHREPAANNAIDLDGLIARGLLARVPAGALRTPPRITARSATERAALGYLYGNCSGCHNAHSSIAALGLDLDQRVASAETQAALLTTVGVPSAFAIPNVDHTQRIAPGRVEASALAYRMSSRFAATQMPPLGTSLVDDEALALIRAWISNDLSEVGKERE